MSDRAQGWLAGGGEMGKVVRAKDWSKTPLGPIEAWPQSLRTTVSLCLSSNFPISLAWGPKHVQIYNDGYWPICGAKHPHSMGQDFTECWASAWPAISAAFERALAGQTSFLENQRMFLDRNGYLEETFFTFSFSPIRDETGGVGGLFHPVTETTPNMLSERRTRALRDVAACTANAPSLEESLRRAAETLSAFDLDLPFTLLYLVDGTSARLVARSGLPQETVANPAAIDLDDLDGKGWALGRVARSGRTELVKDLEGRFGHMPSCGPYPEPPRAALVHPIVLPGGERPLAFLVTGLSTRLPLDEAYRAFCDLLAATVTTAVASARAYDEEKKRAAALAELDRAKTDFFSNVSHEFRTPLTLMLGTVEEVLATSDPASELSQRLAVAHRNGLRLLRLVNSLLDFSRIEAGRSNARYQPTELGALTADLVSNFRSACEKAGLLLRIECSPLPERVHVDREMWEKVVLNLVSNAFKFTVEGEIAVKLVAAGDRCELTVRDTGVGIPEAELPRIFERFHRVESTRGRTLEGSGIGLSLVQELVHLHGGTVRVASVLGSGTTFTVSVPVGREHLPQDRVVDASPAPSAPAAARPFVEEALRWLPDGDGRELRLLPDGEASPDAPADPARRRVLVADDNADMREYVKRILAQRFRVEAVGDGAEALRAARRERPALVVTDVMMPRLDGFGLLRELRDDPELRTLPVILLSARAGDEAKGDGMERGADDYLVKPFSARELLARVSTHIALVEVREEVERALGREEALKETDRRKNEFLAMLSHELRNPLAPIRNSVYILAKAPPGGEQARRAQEVIERQVSHLTRMVEDLLEASRLTQQRMQVERERLELGAIARRVAEDYRATFQASGVTLDVEVAGEPLHVLADPTRLAQVIGNLLANSAKFTPHGGRAVLALRRDEATAVIRVRDDGAGMRADTVEQLFRPFVQADRTLARSKSGLGLGLTIVKGLVELHGGTVAGHSDGPGSGSEFTVRLPLAGVEQPPRSAVAQPAPPEPGRRVLVIEDNVDAASSLRDALELDGHVVEVVHTGEDGLERASEFGPEFVICDIGLPGIDGYTVARRIRATAQARPPRLLALTGYAAPEDVEKARAAGFDHHFPKPPDMAAIAKVLGREAPPEAATG